MLRGVILLIGSWKSIIPLLYVYIVLVCVGFLNILGLIWTLTIIQVRREIDRIRQTSQT